jgi:hypothetical protein
VSIAIWSNIRDAVREVGTSEQAKEFELCRNRESIAKFLNKHFPLSEDRDWSEQAMTQVPDTLRKGWGKEK